MKIWRILDRKITHKEVFNVIVDKGFEGLEFFIHLHQVVEVYLNLR